jgi:hypothetical protein
LQRFSEECRLDSSQAQTEWRSAQSDANRSPVEFPANREKYREFADFGPLKPDFFSLNRSFCGTTARWAGNWNREFTGRIREFISPIREVLRPGLERKIFRVKAQDRTVPALTPQPKNSRSWFSTLSRQTVVRRRKMGGDREVVRRHHREENNAPSDTVSAAIEYFKVP